MPLPIKRLPLQRPQPKGFSDRQTRWRFDRMERDLRRIILSPTSATARRAELLLTRMQRELRCVLKD